MTGRSVDSDIERPPAIKRRKLRKGTKSCWECKRRKTRCTFVTSSHITCDGCTSRRTECIGQDHVLASDDEAANGTADRLDRVEALVEQLAHRGGTNLLTSPQDAEAQPWRVAASARVPTCPDLSTPNTVYAPDAGLHPHSSRAEICGALLATWPSERVFDLVISMPVGASVLFHGAMCMPYSTFERNSLPSTRQLLQPPSARSHPVLIARKLLMLGSFLQAMPAVAVQELERHRIEPCKVASHMIQTASRLVTSNDELIGGSLEGIECIMIESMVQNNAGHLRQAWLTNRRAMLIAQVMELHRNDLPVLKVLEVGTRNRIDPKYMWSRIVITDRYLSLMLRLPQGSPETNLVSPKVLEGCVPMERLERIEAAVAGLILRRNSDNLHNLEATYEVEKLLQSAAKSMPAQWWLAPDHTSFVADDTNATLRMMNQLTHYHLLAQLHLPYLLQCSTNHKYDHSKITAVNASREVLSRFVSFRGSNTLAVYCRGIDFLALVSSTTMCLAHIDACRQHETSSSIGATTLHYLTHQRLGDLGLMERTLEIFDTMAQGTDDAVATNVAGILQRLLVIEAAAANGESYIVSSSIELGERVFTCGANEGHTSERLCIDIPCIGSVKFEKPIEEPHVTASDREFIDFGYDLEPDQLLIPDITTNMEDWALHGVVLPSFDAFDGETNNPTVS